MITTLNRKLLRFGKETPLIHMYKPNIEGVIVYLYPVLDSAQRSFNYKVLRLISPFV